MSRPQRGSRNAMPASPAAPAAAKRALTKPVIIAGAALYLVSCYAGYTLYQLSSLDPIPWRDTLRPASAPAGAATSEPGERPDVYDDISSAYDKEIDRDERLLGIPRLRKRLLSHASGDVLEAACGTGRNLEHYPTAGTITSLTLVDRSPGMMDVCESKWTTLRGRFGDKTPDTTFIPHDINGISPARRSYNTVVQTFGLCSVADPVSYLRHLSSFADGRDGQVLLLEHGRSGWGWVNYILDRTARGHAARWGCYYNRDIDAIVRECEDVLDVISCERRHLGTTYIYRLRPKQQQR
ncbi:hypothetical protein PYCC9005_002818 [Savitreella phatthalungensis]